ncbi:MAG TPA: hypothetical protein VE863_11555 [Pyrinomonadaceae bacterium]|jgi:hypothetical protein|nr:hypothetical protein [Pyrinomonadaceae bacterium]
MFRLSIACAFLITIGLALSGSLQAIAQDNQPPQTQVHLHWGQRRGVVRYRMQLAADTDFRDIIFDRVITGTQIELDDLAAGKYFWRIAPLTTRLGEFSSAGVIVIPVAQPQESQMF